MNILIASASYIFSDHVPGGEFQICHAVVERLAKRGHHVHVFAPLVKLNHPIPNTTIYELGGYDFVGSRNYTQYHLKWGHFQRLAYAKAKQLIRQTNIDVIHHIRPAYPPKYNLCSRLDVPFIFGPMSLSWSASASHGGVSRWISKPWSPITDRIADRFNKHYANKLWSETLENASYIPISVPSARDKVIPKHLHERSPLIPLGVDANVFTPGSKTHSPKILFVGKLEKRKGVDHLLNAMPDVIAQHPEITLEIVGGGEEEGNLKAQSKKLNIDSHVNFVGAVPFQDMPSYYQMANIFCLPSLGEPFGITVLQAMASGLPIVSTQAGGIPEFVEDGKSGLLVPPEDPAALSQALCKLLSDNALRTQIGNHNRHLGETRFDWDAVVDQIESLYQKAI